MKMFYPTSCLAAAAAMALAGPAMAAHVGTITDTTPGTANNDGTIASGEYAGSTSGINSGFGDVIGQGSLLFLDSSSTGTLSFGIRSAVGSLGNNAVIYIDSIAGGFDGTSMIEDTADAGRAAISGDAANQVDNPGAQSEISFAPGASAGAAFLADFAISIDNGFVGLFQLNENAPLTFVADGNQSVNGGDREFAFDLIDIGLTPGDSFNYFATYLNADNAFRSDEFQGVRDQNGFDLNGTNIGNNDIALADGDYLTFDTVPLPEPASLVLLGMGGLMVFGRRRA